jgi:hypothetical protein
MLRLAADPKGWISVMAGQHPLPHRHVRDDVVDQVRCGLRHAPCAARGAETPPLAAERQQLVVAALAAAQPQEAVRQDAAAQMRAGPDSGDES